MADITSHAGTLVGSASQTPRRISKSYIGVVCASTPLWSADVGDVVVKSVCRRYFGFRFSRIHPGVDALRHIEECSQELIFRLINITW